jgi:RNA polymerase sigma-70 factor (ECF subfamily)
MQTSETVPPTTHATMTYIPTMNESAGDRAPDPAVVQRLVQSHEDFLAFLTPRVPSPAVAEEILQAAFVRTLEKGGSIENGESAVAWFYRLLRNALVDYYRRRAREGRMLESAAAEVMPSEPELKQAVCQCVGTLLPTLKPEYAEMIRRVDLEEQPLGAVAAALDITANNAGVRLHRARQSLKNKLEQCCGSCATHGCVDCSCKH